MLTALVTAALLAGLAGAWSPCGFSMVDTLAPNGYGRRMRLTAVACAAFAAGALAGGVATFGGLALLGSELGAGGGGATAVAAAIMLLAAAGDAAGRRIVPQIRRQVPESWRRVLPVALAAALYGVLLGLGFTTFVLSFAVYALAAACLALGEPGTGVAIGLAFACGRIVPVVVLAPLQETDRGMRIAGAMGERPAVLRAIRATGAIALIAAALVLALGGSAALARTPLLTISGTDPSAAGGAVAWQLPGGGPGVLQRAGGVPEQLPGADAALGPATVVWREGEELVVADQATLAVRQRILAPGAEEPAVSDRWLVWRAREPSGDVLRVLDLDVTDQPPAEICRLFAPERIGRPSIEGDRVVFHVARRSSSRIEEVYLPTGLRTVLRAGGRGVELLNPSEQGGELLFIRSSSEQQRVRIGPRRVRDGSRDRTLLAMHPPVRRDAGHEPGRHRHGAGYPHGRAPALAQRAPPGTSSTLWSTALAPDLAYVSRMRRSAGATTNVVLALTRR